MTKLSETEDEIAKIAEGLTDIEAGDTMSIDEFEQPMRAKHKPLQLK